MAAAPAPSGHVDPQNPYPDDYFGGEYPGLAFCSLLGDEPAHKLPLSAPQISLSTKFWGADLDLELGTNVSVFWPLDVPPGSQLSPKSWGNS